jgi:hypothetical protein
MIHDQVGAIILGSVFLFIGLAACALAAIRGGEVRPSQRRPSIHKRVEHSGRSGC